MHRLVGDADGADMLFRVCVLHLVGIDEAQAVAEKFDIFLLAGEQLPAGTDAVGLGVGAEYLRRACSGCSEIDAMKISVPTRGPSSSCKRARFSVISGQIASQSVKKKLMRTILPFITSS